MDRLGSSSLTSEQFAEIRRLRFSARHLVTQGVTGDYRSAFRGHGLEFEEVREYTPGDDIRLIDWKVTARTNTPYIKTYREERDLNVCIAIDVSASTHTGTQKKLRQTLITEVATVLSLIALNNNDKVALITYSDRLEKYLTPGKGRNAISRLIQHILTPGEVHPGTNLSEFFRFIRKAIKKRSIVFILSDFIDSNYQLALSLLAKHHDTTAILINDPADRELPRSGLVQLTDPESQQSLLLDTASAHFHRSHQTLALQHREALMKMFRMYQIGVLPLETNSPYMPRLQRFFSERSVRMKLAKNNYPASPIEHQSSSVAKSS